MEVSKLNSKTFSNCIKLLQANYEKMTNNAELLNIWFRALKHYTDEVFIDATKKIMLNEVYPPKLDTLAKYCSEIVAPIIDDNEGWGLVVKAINNYGYMRVEEAMKSLPVTVRKAVEYMGGLKLICESEEPDVIRGQFNKCMASVNQRERANRRERDGLEQAVALMNNTKEDMALIEPQEWKRTSDDVVNEGLEKVYEAIRSSRKENEI